MLSATGLTKKPSRFCESTIWRSAGPKRRDDAVEAVAKKKSLAERYLTIAGNYGVLLCKNYKADRKVFLRKAITALIQSAICPDLSSAQFVHRNDSFKHHFRFN